MSDTTDQEALPIIAPDGILYAIGRGKTAPARVIWVAAWQRAIGLCEDAGALRTLRRENGPHLGSVSEIHPKDVEDVERMIDARMKELVLGEDGQEPGEKEG